MFKKGHHLLNIIAGVKPMTILMIAVGCQAAARHYWIEGGMNVYFCFGLLLSVYPLLF